MINWDNGGLLILLNYARNQIPHVKQWGWLFPGIGWKNPEPSNLPSGILGNKWNVCLQIYRKLAEPCNKVQFCYSDTFYIQVIQSLCQTVQFCNKIQEMPCVIKCTYIKIYCVGINIILYEYIQVLLLVHDVINKGIDLHCIGLRYYDSK